MVTQRRTHVSSDAQHVSRAFKLWTCNKQPHALTGISTLYGIGSREPIPYSVPSMRQTLYTAAQTHQVAPMTEHMQTQCPRRPGQGISMSGAWVHLSGHLNGPRTLSRGTLVSKLPGFAGAEAPIMGCVAQDGHFTGS